ncbi:site-specific DNA-methyltransferase [Streptomyces sp. STR69]|uniref:site-specific DNA-methyltransferase n=1 Tax=Streptomyces sp. STR69 TaxID=1796942 RepID=UPI0021C6CA83|nr:site-specific DNA-methyltransferase [Streptomyces sp. STR69]
MPESVADRVVRAHETVFHFARGPRYRHDPEHARLPGVWTVPTTPLKVRAALEDARHFAAMPEALPRRSGSFWTPSAPAPPRQRRRNWGISSRSRPH